MPERATVFHTNQIGVETTYGTAVAATKLLQAASIFLGPKVEVQEFRPGGTKFNTSTALSKEWTEGKLSGGVSYQEIPYWFTSVLKNHGAPTAGAGAEQNWTWLPAAGSPDLGKSYTLEQGGGPRAHKVAGLMVNDLSLKATRSSVELDGSVFAKALTDNIYMSTSELLTLTITGGTPASGAATPIFGGVTGTTTIPYNATAAQAQTALEAHPNIGAGNVVCAGGPWPGTGITVQFTGSLGAQNVGALTFTDTFSIGDVNVAETTPGVAPTTLSLVPVAATHTTVLLADAYTDGADTGYTTLARPLEAEWGISGRYGMVWVLDGLTTFVATVETVPTLTCRLKMEADAEAMALLTTMRTNASKFIRIRQSGATISAAPYLIQYDAAVRVREVSEFSDSDGLYAIEWQFAPIYTTDILSAMKVRVRNTLAGL